MSKSKTLLFASCNTDYYNKYAKAFVKSAASNQHYVHVHIINPYVGMERVEHPLISYSFEEGAPKSREYYAANRYFLAPNILMSNNDELKLLMLDIDTIVQNPVKLPKAAIGLYLRKPYGVSEWEIRGSRVFGGAVMYDDTAWLFAKTVADKLNTLPQYWQLDQVALAETMDEFKNSINIHDFSKDKDFISWNLLDTHASLLAAKGDRKTSSVYKEMLNYYENLELN